MINKAEIKRRREALQLSYDEAAERAGLGDNPDSRRTRWWRIENAKMPRTVDADTLLRIARVLKCRMEELLIDDDDDQAAAPAKKAKGRKRK